MYQISDDNTTTLTVADWIRAGLTYDQFKNDSKRGYLKVAKRGLNGSTLIDVGSIERPERLRVLEAAYGKAPVVKRQTGIYRVEVDAGARAFYLAWHTPEGHALAPDRVEEYTNQASILNGIRRGLIEQREARLRCGDTRMNMGQYWQTMVGWYLEQIEAYPAKAIGNPRSLERVFKQYCKEGYAALIHKNQGNDSARVVSALTERLLLALWRANNKPFIKDVHRLYHEFVAGVRTFYDRGTGEQFNPADFCHKGRALEISEATVWNYLRHVVNETAVYADRNGNFDYANTRRPKHKRKLGEYSLSKISMDDVALSRKAIGGWVYKYMAVDVLSGYWFRPAYVKGKPTLQTVYETFRNMFCELEEMGLPQPGELEVEYALMKHIPWLNKLFPHVRFASSPTEKRAEHAIKSLKYGVSKREGHMKGRWYAKSEAHRCVRNKVDGDYVEPELQPQTIVKDDLSDIEKHNNELHPLQKTFPGLTRRDVMLKMRNPSLKPLEPWYLYRYIGNETETSIYNNDYCRVQQMDFWLKDFGSLDRLKPNNREVTAYWMPKADGSIETVYLYQGDTYIGEAYNTNSYRYNEFRIERTAADDANMLHQEKRIAKYDKMIRTRRDELPKLYSESAEETQARAITVPEIIETEQPRNYDGYDDDWEAKAIHNF